MSLTTADAYSAFVEFCTRRGWVALPKNKFTSGIADAVVRQFGLTLRHDILDDRGKPQRGWKGLSLSPAWSSPSASVASGEPSPLGLPDSSDAFTLVHPAKTTPAAEVPLFTL